MYASMLARWVSTFQKGSGTMESADAAVWRSMMGTLGTGVPSAAGFDSTLYAGLSRDCVKKVAFCETKACGVV